MLHLISRERTQGHIRDLVEGDEVDTARDTTQEAGKLRSVLVAIVHPIEYDILEGDAALPREVGFADHLQRVLQGQTTLGRHQLQTPLVEGIVQADCQMAGRLAEEALKATAHTDRREGDALRRPTQAPRRG